MDENSRIRTRRLLLAASATLLFCSTAARATAAEEISLLVYNTHGLPALIAGDDPHGRFPEIGRHTQRYDLTLLQEDFGHHERLRTGLGNPSLVQRGNESRMTWCPLCSGSGLTLISRLPPDWQISIQSYPYEACSGWLGKANDCLATKGFQLARVVTPQGARFHILNTHLDAGGDEADRLARSLQLGRIRAIVTREVEDGALIVAGDLNLDDGNEADRQLFGRFVESLGLTDSGARAAPGTTWTVLDYILYRSGPQATLRVLGAGEDQSLVWNGAPLSDHPALWARLEVGLPEP